MSDNTPTLPYSVHPSFFEHQAAEPVTVLQDVANVIQLCGVYDDKGVMRSLAFNMVTQPKGKGKRLHGLMPAMWRNDANDGWTYRGDLPLIVPSDVPADEGSRCANKVHFDLPDSAFGTWIRLDDFGAPWTRFEVWLEKNDEGSWDTESFVSLIYAE